MGISYGICLPDGGCLLDVAIQHTLPGLVNVYIANWKDPPCLMGKSTISMVIFNSKLLVYQRVHFMWWVVKTVKSLGARCGWVRRKITNICHPSLWGPVRKMGDVGPLWGPCGATENAENDFDSLETKAVIAPGTSGVFHGRSFKSLGGAGLPMWRSWEGG